MVKKTIQLLFGKKQSRQRDFCLTQADFTEVTVERKNPARGWYQIFTFWAEQEPDWEELGWCIQSQDALALVLINIGHYQDKDLEEADLNRIRKILRFFQENKQDVILRIVYDHEGKAMEKEPFFFAQVLRHLEQVGTILQEFAELIFVFQGVLIGNWGEMHTSRFLRRDKLEKMIEKLRLYRGKQTFLAVRRPMQWRMLHSSAAAPAECADKMGLFNDGLFGSRTHLGTFGSESSAQTGWEGAWTVEEEKAFVDALCQSVPNGGEVVYKDNYTGTLTQEEMLDELRKMHITYLNRVHDSRTLDIWKKQTYQGNGVWKGKSVYQYIGAHLGYRLLVQNVALVSGAGAEKKPALVPGAGTEKKPALVPGVSSEQTVAYRQTEKDSQSAVLQITLENIGFAALYQDAECYVEWISEVGESRLIQLSDKLGVFRSGEVRTICVPLEPEEGKLFLRARRSKDKAVIYFANASDEEGRVALGDIRRNRKG